MSSPSNNDTSFTNETYRYRSVSTPDQNSQFSDIASNLKNTTHEFSYRTPIHFDSTIGSPKNDEKRIKKISKEKISSSMSDYQKINNFSSHHMRSNNNNQEIGSNKNQMEHPIHLPTIPPIDSPNTARKKMIQRTNSERSPKEIKKIVGKQSGFSSSLYSVSKEELDIQSNGKNRKLKAKTTVDKSDKKWWNFFGVTKKKDSKSAENVKSKDETTSFIDENNTYSSMSKYPLKEHVKDESISISIDTATISHSSKEKSPLLFQINEDLAQIAMKLIGKLESEVIPFIHWRETVLYRIYRYFYKASVIEPNKTLKLSLLIEKILSEVQSKPIDFASNFKLRVNEFLAKIPTSENYSFLVEFISISDPIQFQEEMKKYGLLEQQIINGLIGERVTLMNLIMLKKGSFQRTWSTSIEKLYQKQKLLEERMIKSEQVSLTSGNVYPLKFINTESVVDSFRAYFDLCHIEIEKREWAFSKDLSQDFFSNVVQLGCITINGRVLNLPYIENEKDIKEFFFRLLIEALQKEGNIRCNYPVDQQVKVLISKIITEDERDFIKKTLEKWLSPFINDLSKISEKEQDEYLNEKLPELFEMKSMIEGFKPIFDKLPELAKNLIHAIQADRSIYDRLRCNIASVHEKDQTIGIWAFLITNSFMNFCSYQYVKGVIPTIIALKSASINAYAAAEYNLRTQLSNFYDATMEVKTDRDEDVPNVTRLDFIIDNETKIFEVIHTKAYVIKEKNVENSNKVRFKVQWKLSSNFDGNEIRGIRKTIEPYFAEGCSDKFMNEVLDRLNKNKDLKTNVINRKSHSLH